MKWLLLITGFAGMLGAGAVSAEIFRWVDEAGNVHFGDQPPGQGAERVSVPKAPPVDPQYLQRLERQKAFLDARQQERQKAKEAQQVAQQKQQEREENCGKIRNQMASLQRGRIYQEDENGGRRFLSDAEIAQELGKLQVAAEQWCD